MMQNGFEDGASGIEVQETKGGGVAQSTQFSVADVPAGLHVPTFHIAAALGDLEAIEAALTDAAETAAAEVLNEREPFLGRRPIHFAVSFAQPEVVKLFLSAEVDITPEDIRAFEDAEKTAKDAGVGLAAIAFGPYETFGQYTTKTGATPLMIASHIGDHARAAALERLLRGNHIRQRLKANT